MNTTDLTVLDRDRDVDVKRRVAVHNNECRCGQDLTVCHRAHCPRCGANLSRR